MKTITMSDEEYKNMIHDLSVLRNILEPVNQDGSIFLEATIRFLDKHSN